MLDPNLQQENKSPRWKPRAQRGTFLRSSTYNSIDFSLVLKVNVGHISPQYHVVFDYFLSTLNSHSEIEDPPSFWSKISLDSHIYDSYIHLIILDTNYFAQLHDEWLPPPYLEERVRTKERQAKIRGMFNISSSRSSQDISATKCLSPLTPKYQDDSLLSQDNLLANDDNFLLKLLILWGFLLNFQMQKIPAVIVIKSLIVVIA